MTVTPEAPPPPLRPAWHWHCQYRRRHISGTRAGSLSRAGRVQAQTPAPPQGPLCAHCTLCCREACHLPLLPSLSRDGRLPLSASCTDDAENTQVRPQILRTSDPDSAEALGVNLGSRGCSSLWLTRWVTVLYGCSSLDRLGGQDSF